MLKPAKPGENYSMKHSKLVRDKIPEIIQAKGEDPKIHIATGEELQIALLQKLVEEAQELLADPCLAERADVAEVLAAIDRSFGFSETDITSVQSAKRKERGGFEQGIILEGITPQ